MKLLIIIATFFNIGRIPKAPGTFGTLAALPLVYLLNLAGPFYYMGACILLLPLAVLAASAYEQHSGQTDASAIVIDEVLGMLIAMTWLPMSWQSFVFAFVLFRLLDITKPFPIGYLEKRLKGGLGVVADDILAGVLTNLVLQVVFTQTTWLGVQMVS